MKYIADLHIHSRFSMATARTLDLEHLQIWAQLKGITVVGTGDITHPGWLNEISEKIVPAEPGLFRLKDSIARNCEAWVPFSCRHSVRFILSSEICCVYKKNGVTRKNHNLVFFPNLRTAATFIKHLERIGNISSDGRPVLSLDAKNLLEMVLESSEKAFLIPAHIWTPWFSLLGSKSGFDSVEECFEELTAYVFALETGLSSDPPMNWRVSKLDNMTLVSNSDAHSPDKLGREANLFNTDLSFDSLRAAIKSGDPDKFLGTLEFYPEEGKYYLDGHRKCGTCLKPSETKAIHGICPICGKPLIRGVLNRLEMLSDRPERAVPNGKPSFFKLVALTNLLSELFQVGPNTKIVKKNYNTIISKLGGELAILNELPLDELDRAGISFLTEAIYRMRQGKIEIIPGYDGQYGQIRIFSGQERRRLAEQRSVFAVSAPIQ